MSDLADREGGHEGEIDATSTSHTELINKAALDARLLDDSPAATDEFAGKGHESIATSIASLVQQESGGRVIGLQGTWGSGKSTIVGLIHDLLLHPKTVSKDSQKEVKLFLFDAWAHQGDPLRRSFLEQLLDQMKGWKWLSNRDADERRDRLSGRKTEERTKTSARLTIEGTLASLAILLVPIGVALFANRFQSWHGPLVLAGVLLMFAPIFVVFGFTLAILGARALDSSSRVARTPLFSFFAKEQKTDTTTQRIERGQPTSVEFEDEFHGLLEVALVGDRRLVIVLDNLDRVDQRDARSVFATMQTFTGSSRLTATEPWATRLWTLVPFDLPGLERLWERSTDESTEQNYSSTDDTASAFFEKIFEVRFTVPPLVLSDWRGYLLTLLKQALPNADSDDLEKVERLRALYPATHNAGAVAAERPTPRQLKQFVNQMVSILLQRNDIPLIHIAYFALLQRDGESIPEFLSRPNDVPSSLDYLLGSDIEIDLAALHFGTSRELGQELLLKVPLENALAGSDVEQLKELSNRSGFVQALDGIDIGRWIEAGGVELTRNVSAFKAAELFEDQRLTGWIDGQLRPAAERATYWRLVDRSTGLGLAAVCSLLSQDAVVSLFGRIETIPAEGGDANSALSGLASFGLELKRLKVSINELRVELNLTGADSVRGVAFFGRQSTDRSVLNVLKITQSASEIATAVIETAVSPQDPNAAVVALNTLGVETELVDAPTLLEQCGTRLRNEEIGSPQLDALVGILDSLRFPKASSEACTDMLRQLSDDGTLAHHLSRANSSGWYDAAALLSMLFLSARPSSTEPTPSRESATGITVLRQVVANPEANEPLAKAQTEWLKKHSGFAAWFLLTRLRAEVSIAPWGDYQIRALFKASKFSVRKEEFVQDWQVIQRALGDADFLTFLGGYVSNTGQRTGLLAESLSDDLMARLVEAAVTVNSEDANREVIDSAVKRADGAPKDEWLSGLRDPTGGILIPMTLRLVDLGAQVRPSTDLKDALLEYAKELQSGVAGWRPEAGAFESLVLLLSAESQHVLASQICASLEGATVDPAFLAVFGDFLANAEGFRKHGKLFNFVEQLVANDRWDELGWFVELAGRHPQDTLSADGRKVELENLKTKVREKLGAQGDDVPDELRRLADHLGVKVKSQKKESKEL